MPADPSNSENWSGEDKLMVVIETAALNEQGLSEYCRKKGLYPEQIARWKEGAIAVSPSSTWRVLTHAGLMQKCWCSLFVMPPPRHLHLIFFQLVFYKLPDIEYNNSRLIIIAG